RRGDDARMYAGLPWHVLRAVLSALPGVLVGALVGAAVLWAGDRALGEPRLLPTGVDASVVRWSAGLAALGVAWLAPTSMPLREGARATIGVLAPTRAARTVLGVLLAFLAAVGLLLAVGGDPAPVWSPLPEPPSLPDLPWVSTT
ncbi:hypothetical protein PU560_09705, partial [Georgenia sp. 10Sc9-8]|nr:hypothetical protein [Georgenia halotolerans]